MTNTYRFYKEEEKWYIDLPEWIENGGPKEALQMVLGADDLLDDLTGNIENEITLEISDDDNEFFDWDESYMLCKTYNNPPGDGATYTCVTNTVSNTREFVVWLCPVTLFIFGSYPYEIYFKVVS